MPCFYHPDREPIASCVDCGRLVCADCATTVGNQTVCPVCAGARQSARELPPRRKERKSPVIAVLLSVIPGLGQMYNEQLVKGLVIMILYFLMVVSFVGGGSVLWARTMGMGLDLHEFSDQFRFLHLRGPLFASPFGVAFPTFPSLTLLLLIILIYCYAIYDAAVTASRINRGEVVLHKPRGPRPPHRPTAATDEQLRKGAAAAMGTSPPDQTQAPQIDSGKKPGPWHSGKTTHMARMGWVLIIVGLILWGEIANIWLLSFEHIWPIIPLLLGVRLLYDYRRYQEQSQLLLGLIFSVIGVFFLLRSFEPMADLFEAVIDYWPLCLVALGLYLIWASRKGHEVSKKNQSRNGE